MFELLADQVSVTVTFLFLSKNLSKNPYIDECCPSIFGVFGIVIPRISTKSVKTGYNARMVCAFQQGNNIKSKLRKMTFTVVQQQAQATVKILFDFFALRIRPKAK